MRHRPLVQLLLVFVSLTSVHLGLRLLRNAVPTLDDSPDLYPREFLKDATKLNSRRSEIAEAFFKKSKYSYHKNAEVEVRIVASDRGSGYLLQTIAFLLNQQEDGNFNIRICNVESGIFPDLVQFAKTFRIDNVGGGRRKSSELDGQLAKEAEDYWNCLALPTNSSFILLIEDDSLVAPKFHRILKSLTNQLEEFIDIDFVKLYHLNRLRKIPFFVQTICMAILISFLLFSTVLRQIHPVIFLLIVPVIAYDFYGYGCQFPAEFRYALTGSAYMSLIESCCTPAVLFRTSSAPAMTSYFMRQKASDGHAKDHILDESPFVGRQTDLNLVVHVGAFSSVRQHAVVLSDLNDMLNRV
ncbi:unnamed protein product [Caenorhabditis auriculariae]|uniref:Glycosyltransferase family 92 protein n=1 Tax=Caenorhabditis auriculariae TaxID=2777116 RepID=A0A8S1HAZ8_9PELO|nr:unnamed protein product [Caenorhabditis auriculariae]